MKQRHWLLILLCAGLLLSTLSLTGCSDLFGSEDDSSQSEDASSPELDPPYHLSAEVNKDGFTVLLSWNMDTSQEYELFTVERGTPSMTPQEIGVVGRTTLAYGDESTLAAGTYIYRVGAVEGSEIVYCESVTIEITD